MNPSKQEELDKLIAERFEISKTQTSSSDPVVQIAWLAKGIDIWHMTNGKMGSSPENAMHYIISSVTRLIHSETVAARKDEHDKLYEAFVLNMDIAEWHAHRVVELMRETLKGESYE